MSLLEKGKVLLKVPHLFVDNNNDVYQDFRIVGVVFRKAIHGEGGGVCKRTIGFLGFFFISIYIHILEYTKGKILVKNEST